MTPIHVSMSGGAVELRSAVLFYGGDQQDSSGIATVHSVAVVDGKPEIQAGRLLTREDLAELTECLHGAHSAGAQWLDVTMLAQSRDRMIWYTPPGTRPMFFKSSPHCKKNVEGNCVLPVPGLVWVVQDSSLYVYATTEKGRPSRDTQLYQAPFWNIWARGQVCVGSAKLPNGADAWVPKKWEEVVFNSRFTHPNFTEPNRLLKGVDSVDYWKKQLAAPSKSFNNKLLVPIGLTVQDLLSPVLQESLARIPEAEGEF